MQKNAIVRKLLTSGTTPTNSMTPINGLEVNFKRKLLVDVNALIHQSNQVMFANSNRNQIQDGLVLVIQSTKWRLVLIKSILTW